MAENRKIGIIFRTLDNSLRSQIGYKRLLWAAEAGPAAGSVLETDGDDRAVAQMAVDLIREKGLAGVIVAGCPLAGIGDRLLSATAEAGLDPQLAVGLEVAHRTETAYRISAGARQALLQAMTVMAGMEEPVYEYLTPSTDVLVYGLGFPALTAADELRRAGYGVLLAGPGEKPGPEVILEDEEAARVRDLLPALEKDPGVEIITGGRLIGLGGAAGDFTCRIRAAERVVTRTVGAAIITDPPPMKPNLEGLDLPLRRRVKPISRLLSGLAGERGLERYLPTDSQPRIGLLVGLGRESNPAQFRAALNAAARLQADFGARVSILTGNAKTAAPDLERKVQEARAQGIILTKFAEPRIEALAAPQMVRLTYIDEVLKRPVRQEFDLLAVDETPSVDDEYLRLADVLRLNVGSDGYLQPDQVNTLPVLSPRAGVYLVGPARGPVDIAVWRDEALAAVLGVRHLLRGGRVRVRADRVVIDKGKCAVCLTCLRVCPERAIGVSGAHPVISPLACTVCGSCASECPQDAIQAANLGDGRFESEIRAAVKRSESGIEPFDGPEILVFACANSASKAIARARAEGQPWPEGVRLIELPCAGKLDPAYLLLAFNLGFDGVLILSCYEKACYSYSGSTWAGYRAEHVRMLLSETGLDPRRLVKTQLSPAQAAEALGLVNRMAADLARLGPNPLKTVTRTAEFLDRFTVNVDANFTIATPETAGATAGQR